MRETKRIGPSRTTPVARNRTSADFPIVSPLIGTTYEPLQSDLERHDTETQK